MERTFGQDERIRRAEEIYLRRQSLKNRNQRVTLTANNEPKNFKLFKKLAIQIVICIALYYIFHLLNTTNYTFSEDTLNKTRELISKDYDFYGIYAMIVENVNDYLYPEENTVESKEENSNENNKESEQNTNDGEEKQEENNIQTDEEGVNQTEVSYTEESETERIKKHYAFALPLSGGIISSEFGEREVNASVITAYHKGIDIAADIGTSIVSATDGEVVISKYSPSYGNYVMIQKEEVKTVYAHCSERLVSVRR